VGTESVEFRRFSVKFNEFVNPESETDATQWRVGKSKKMDALAAIGDFFSIFAFFIIF
jgi:hypothetical protein